MGGRGSSSGRGAKGGSNSGGKTVSFLGKEIQIGGTDKMGIPKNVMDERTFLSHFGVSSPVSSYSVDKYGGANRTRLSQRQRDALDKKTQQEEQKYFEKREQVRNKYNQLVSDGTLKKPTMLQSALRTAQGHPDLQATKSARNICKKLGYDWKTGKKLSK